MKIRTRLWLIVILSPLFAALVAVQTYVLQDYVRGRLQRVEVVRQLMRAGFELDLMTREVVYGDGARQRSQWRARYRSCVALVGEIEAWSLAPAISKGLQANIKELDTAFEELTIRRGEVDRGSGADSELLQSLSDQTSDRCLALVGYATELVLLADRDVERAMTSGMQVAIATALAGGLLLLGFGALLSRHLNRSLASLGTAVQHYGQFDLHHQVDIQGQDELADLGRAFSAMAAELRGHRDHLDGLVEARTRELGAANSDLERSNRELEQFAYVASHDLQEPLRMVASYTELLSLRYAGKLDEKADRYIGYAVEGARRMQSLIEDLLKFSRVGTRRSDPVPVDSAEVLQDVLSDLEVSISEKQAVIEVGRLPVVLSDRNQLHQVFQNLIDNAIKFSGDAPPLVEVGAVRDGDRWFFEVSDRGIGIAEEFRERIFVIFQRLQCREDYGGTGIGLAVVKKIVERHGGRVEVLSRQGKGSRFRFSFPAADMEVPDEEE